MLNLKILPIYASQYTESNAAISRGHHGHHGGQGWKCTKIQDFAFAISKFSRGDTPGPPLREGGNPVAMTHTRPRACTSVPPQFLGPSAAPGDKDVYKALRKQTQLGYKAAIISQTNAVDYTSYSFILPASRQSIYMAIYRVGQKTAHFNLLDVKLI